MTLMKKKRGQTHLEGGRAAGVVGLMIIILVLYIILLPPEERDELLGEDDIETKISEKEKNITLLLEDPGTISFIGQKDADKDIPNVYLYKDTNAKIIERFKRKK